jgi:DNA-binding response OmpR family regulator
LNDLRVLVVEDEPLIGMALADELEAAGALVLGPATSVESALTTVEQDGPLAAVLDVELCGELVTPVADALRARGVPFVFTTGYDSKMLPEEYLAVPRCMKPAPADEVLTLLCSVLAQVEAVSAVAPADLRR